MSTPRNLLMESDKKVTKLEMLAYRKSGLLVIAVLMQT